MVCLFSLNSNSDTNDVADGDVVPQCLFVLASMAVFGIASLLSLLLILEIAKADYVSTLYWPPAAKLVIIVALCITFIRIMQRIFSCSVRF